MKVSIFGGIHHAPIASGHHEVSKYFIYGVVNNSDLIHADKHGVVVIPHEIAREVPAACQKVEDRERRTINFCKSPDFNVESLKTGNF